MSFRPRALTLAAAILGIGLTVWGLRRSPAPPPAHADVLPALASVVIPIAHEDPGSDDADLLPLLTMLGNRQVVALGEATHGTSEFFRLKDRLLRFLVRRSRFRIFALEISPEAGARMNRYVQGASDDVNDALRQFEFWTWQTEEVRDLAVWMRSWNSTHAGDQRVAFVGINATGSDRDERMAANVEAALEGNKRLVVWAHNAHVSRSPGMMGAYLHDRIGDRMYVVGFEFFEGSFRSRNLLGLRTHSVTASGPGYYAFELARLSTPRVFVDFSAAARVPALRQWLDAPRRSHDIDELFYVTQLSARWYTRSDPWPRLYDGVIFVRSTTPARGLFDRH